jgi:hypothetical protein
MNVDAESQSGKLELDWGMRVMGDQTLLERGIKMVEDQTVHERSLNIFALLYGRNTTSSVLVVSFVM